MQGRWSITKLSHLEKNKIETARFNCRLSSLMNHPPPIPITYLEWGNTITQNQWFLTRVLSNPRPSVSHIETHTVCLRVCVCASIHPEKGLFTLHLAGRSASSTKPFIVYVQSFSRMVGIRTEKRHRLYCKKWYKYMQYKMIWVLAGSVTRVSDWLFLLKLEVHTYTHTYYIHTVHTYIRISSCYAYIQYSVSYNI